MRSGYVVSVKRGVAKSFLTLKQTDPRLLGLVLSELWPIVASDIYWQLRFAPSFFSPRSIRRVSSSTRPLGRMRAPGGWAGGDGMILGVVVAFCFYKSYLGLCHTGAYVQHLLYTHDTQKKIT